jgi:hypothetical protein
MGYECTLKSDKEIAKLGDIEWVEASYNPYKNEHFVAIKDGSMVSTCRYARLCLDKGLRVSDDYVWNTAKNYRFSRD